MAQFSRELAEAAGWGWDEVHELNETVARLRNRKVYQIARWEGNHELPKIVWKIKIHVQLMLYRVISLADGCAFLANRGNLLCGAVLSRSLFETVVIMYDFSKMLSDLISDSDLSRIDSFVTDKMFASRAGSSNNGAGLPKAINILTLIDRMERDFPGTRFHYEIASEFSHPNYYGHNFTFGTHSKKEYLCNFSDVNKNFHHIAGHMLTGFGSIVLFEAALFEIDRILPHVESLYADSSLN